MAQLGWFQRLSQGLSRSSKQIGEQLVSVIAKRPLDEALLSELEDQLIEADLGPKAAGRIAAAFAKARFGKSATDLEIRAALAEALLAEQIGRAHV